MSRLLGLLLVLTLMLPGIVLVACENREEEATSAPTSTLTATPRAAPTPRVTATLEATPTAEKTAPSEVTSTPKATPQLTPTEEPLTADELIARAYEAMTEESFALDVPPEPPVPQLGQPPYSIRFGAPDVLLMTGRGYEYPARLLLVGSEVYTSWSGRQWVYEPHRPNLQLFRLWYDPRELLRMATDIRDEGTEDLDGRPHRVVTSRSDIAEFLEKYPEYPDGESARSDAPDEVRFWIDRETLLVSKIEPTRKVDSMEELVFIDYGEVELPKPEPSMPYEEVDALFSEVQRRWHPLAEALEAYAHSHDGLYPDELTPNVLQEALESEGLAWPDNAFTGEPMQESPERNPGDFHYQPSADRLQYCAEVYPWAMDGIPVGPPGPEGWMMCPEGPETESSSP